MQYNKKLKLQKKKSKEWDALLSNSKSRNTLELVRRLYICSLYMPSYFKTRSRSSNFPSGPEKEGGRGVESEVVSKPLATVFSYFSFLLSPFLSHRWRPKHGPWNCPNKSTFLFFL